MSQNVDISPQACPIVNPTECIGSAERKVLRLMRLMNQKLHLEYTSPTRPGTRCVAKTSSGSSTASAERRRRRLRAPTWSGGARAAERASTVAGW